MKRLIHIGVLLMAVLALCLLLQPTKAEAATVASGECGADGDNLIWTLDDQGTLTISGTGAMKDWNLYYSPWQNNTSIKSIIIEEGVTSIGSFAFVSTSTETISISSSVASINASAFAVCYNLTSVEIPSGVQHIGDMAFADCSQMERITFLGDAPEMEGNVFGTYNSDWPEGYVTATAYYPANNVTWTSDKMQNYGGKEITWVAFVTVVAQGSCGENLTWTLDDEGVLTVSGTGAMTSWGAYINDTGYHQTTPPWESYKASIVSVIIENSVTSIGSHAFNNCANLRTVDLGSDLKAIEGLAFCGCPLLSGIIFPDNLSSIEFAAFSSTGLTYVVIPQNVTFLSSISFDSIPIFVHKSNKYYSSDSYGCLFDKNKTEIISVPNSLSGSYTIPNSVKTISQNAFNCDNLTQIIIGDGVTTIEEYAFTCENLTSVTIGAGVTTMFGDAFTNCPKLSYIYVAANNTHFSADAYGCLYNKDKTQLIFAPKTLTGNLRIPGSVKEISENAFAGCNKLTSVEIPEGVTSIPFGAFQNCYELESVSLPESLESIGTAAFSCCRSLTEIVIPKNVTQLGGEYGAFPFTGCTNLEHITVQDGNAYYINDEAGCLYNKEKTVLIHAPAALSGSYTIPKTVTQISEYAFHDCTKLTSITIPNSVTHIYEDAFTSCSRLVTVILPSSITYIGQGAFSYCTNLKTVIFEGDIPEMVDYPYYGSFNEGSITAYYPANNETWTEDKLHNYGSTQITWVAVVAQGSCGENLIWSLDENGYLTISGLGDMTQWRTTDGEEWIPAQNSIKTVLISDGVTSISAFAFSECKGLTAVTLSNSITSIGNYAFCYCDHLSEITLPDNLTNIEYSAFIGCSSLKSITIPEGVTTIESGVFQACTSLTSVNLPNGVTIIDRYAFAGCSSLPSLIIPESVTELGSAAFMGCRSLSSITIPDNVTVITGRIFEDCTSLTSVTIPDSTTTIGYYAFSGCTSLKEIFFKGFAPYIGSQVFSGATATAYYPANDPTWTEEVRQNYGGTITWVPYEPEAEIEKFDIDVARMILGNSLEFQFGIAMTKIPDITGYYAVVEKQCPDGTTTTKTIPASQWGKAGAYWAIVYDGLAAKEMADEISVTVYNADGQAISNAKTDSVRAYVARAFDSQTATGKTMMVDMLNYGAAAQVHFGYGTEDLANSELTDEQKAVGTATAPEMSNDLVKGINYTGSRFILTSSIQVQLAFKNMTTDMYAVYTYTKADDTAQEVRVEGADFVVIGGKPAGVELSALVYADARALVNVTVYNADGTVYGTASDSIESCSVRSSGDVFTALMKFADSAKAHLYG